MFFFNSTGTTEIYTLSLHDALPIYEDHFSVRYRDLMRAKLGLVREEEGDDRLIGKLLALMAQARADYTLSFRDRKSTRLNSSHPSISYAVFCLKKKKNRLCQTSPNR